MLEGQVRRTAVHNVASNRYGILDDHCKTLFIMLRTLTLMFNRWVCAKLGMHVLLELSSMK